MNAFLRKEIRLLLPSFATALLLSFSVWLIPRETSSASGWHQVLFLFPFLLCPAMLVMTALDSFGREVGSGTFSNLLSQPISRRRIWGTKTALLAAALGIIFCSWWLGFLLHSPASATNPELSDLALGTALFALSVFAGGQWTVLLFRQVAAAFWVTLIVPGAMAMAVAGLTVKYPGRTEPVMLAVLGIYILAGVLLSRRLFLRAQDVSWTGGNISMPEVRGLRAWLAGRMSHRRWRPRAALFAKEFQLHQSLLVIAGVLALLHLALLVTRPAGGGFHESSAFEFVAYQIWVLWPVMMPLLIGCAAVAEERKLGTLEAQLCLPVRRRTQFAIKFAVALGLLIFLAVLVPVLLEGRRILPNLDTEFIPESLLPLLLVATSLVAIPFYASTLVRNTLQAFAPAVLGIILVSSLFVGALWIGDTSHLWHGWLIYFIGVPALTLTLAGLAYWNFKRVLVGWPVWRRNLFAFVAVLASVVVLTSLIYHRVWEFLTPIEPAHGSERISHLKLPSLHSEPVNALTVTLPDGRLWHGNFTLYSAPGSVPKPTLINSQFLGGSNWMNVVGIQGEQVAIQSNGSLWLIETPSVAFAWTNNKPVVPTPQPARHTRIDNETNWQCVVREGWWPAVLLLKNDGSLWEWGTNQFDFKHKWPRLSSSAIRRLGSESDWADMASAGSSIYLWKKNGQAWAINPYFQGLKKNRVELGPGIQMERYQRFDGTGWRNLASGQPFQVGVRDDGTLWGWGLMGQIFQDPSLSSGQIGPETNWMSVACEDSTTVALKADGSLWKWDFGYQRQTARAAATPARLGTHHDWVGVAGWRNGVVSLAADGSLWHWQFQPTPSRSSGFSIPPLLAASRRPQLLGNIFGQAE